MNDAANKAMSMRFAPAGKDVTVKIMKKKPKKGGKGDAKPQVGKRLQVDCRPRGNCMLL